MLCLFNSCSAESKCVRVAFTFSCLTTKSLPFAFEERLLCYLVYHRVFHTWLIWLFEIL